VSILVEAGHTRLLVDTSPDLREQLLDANVGWLTAVLYTHDHADHCHGIDDLRALFHASGVEIDCYMDRATRASLRTRFSYVFAGRAGYPPTARAHLLTGDMRIGDISVRPFRQQHGPVHSMGFRFDADGKSVAYSTDTSGFPAETWPVLAGLDLWVVDALRRNPHPTHSHLSQTLEWIERVKPAEAWLTHMDQSMDHDALVRELPPTVSPGHDGRVWEGVA
jgi:phosphoribosyl 1,2-cyclic phosphate phosphodiesterase